MTVLVTGAGGNVGSAVVAASTAAGMRVRAVTRTGERAGLPRSAEVVAGDLGDPTTLRAAWDGIESVFLLPGFPATPRLLADARAAGVTFVVQLSGSSAGEVTSTNAITRYMSITEAQVRAAGFAYSVLRPSAFMSNALGWAEQLRAGDVVEEPFADVPIAVIDPADIAAVTVAILTDRERYSAGVYRLSGPAALRPAERLRILGDVLGRPLRLEPLSDSAARARLSSRMPAEYVDAFFDFYVHGSLDESVVHPTVTELTGRAPRSFRDWARAHAQAFR